MAFGLRDLLLQQQKTIKSELNRHISCLLWPHQQNMEMNDGKTENTEERTIGYSALKCKSKSLILIEMNLQTNVCHYFI